MKAFKIALRCALAALLMLGFIGSAFAVKVTDQLAAQLQPGMSMDQVKTLLGKPSKTETYALSGKSTWTYPSEKTYYNTSAYVVEFDANGKLLTSYVMDVTSY